MRFRGCPYTPKSCNCPLPDDVGIAKAAECDCCKHMSFSSHMWSRKAYCNDGETCIIRSFPKYILNQWELMEKCTSSNGFGLDISVEKFKFFMENILHIPEEDWGEVYEILHDIFTTYVTQINDKDKKIHFVAEDVELLKSFNSK